MTQNLTIKRHTELVDRMADTLGIDLEEAVFAGKLDPNTLCDAVLRCTGCTDPEGCTKWLDACQNGTKHPPVMCRNSDMFHSLQDGRRFER
ncbi:MAG: DUF6455 family protein [Pseudomonadota bacterium]